MYKVLFTSLFYKGKYIEIINNEVKGILFKLQFFCKFEYIVRYDLRLFGQKPNLLEKKATPRTEGCNIKCTLDVHIFSQALTCLLRHNLVSKTLAVWNNVKMPPKSRADSWDWLDDFADPGYKEVLEHDLRRGSNMKTKHFDCFWGTLTAIHSTFSLICYAKLGVG